MIKRYVITCDIEWYGKKPFLFTDEKENKNGPYILVEELRTWIESIEPIDLHKAILSLYEELNEN